MRKLLIFLWISLLFLAGGCTQADNEDVSSKVKVEVSHTVTTEDKKTMDISYPIVGGLENSRTLATINSSIDNYIKIQQNEFNNALSDNTTTNPIDGDFDATVTKQIASNVNQDDEAAINANKDETDDETTTEANPDATKDDEEDEDTNNTNSETSSKKSSSTTTKGTSPITLTMEFNITYHHDNILNIVETYEKVLGKNKTYTGQQSFVFDLDKGIPVSLGEIYDFNSDFPDYINEAITKEIDNTKGLTTYDGKEGFTGISKDAKFYIDEESKKIHIFFNAMEISPEKNFIPSFEFSLSKLSPYLTEDYAEIFN